MYEWIGVDRRKSIWRSEGEGRGKGEKRKGGEEEEGKRTVGRVTDGSVYLSMYYLYQIPTCLSI